MDYNVTLKTASDQTEIAMAAGQRRASKRVSFADTCEVQEFCPDLRTWIDKEKKEDGKANDPRAGQMTETEKFPEVRKGSEPEKRPACLDGGLLLTGPIQYFALQGDDSGQDSGTNGVASEIRKRKPLETLSSVANECTIYGGDMSINQNSSSFYVDPCEDDGREASMDITEPVKQQSSAAQITNETIYFEGAGSSMDVTGIGESLNVAMVSPPPRHMSLSDVLRTMFSKEGTVSMPPQKENEAKKDNGSVLKEQNFSVIVKQTENEGNRIFAATCSSEPKESAALAVETPKWHNTSSIGRDESSTKTLNDDNNSRPTTNTLIIAKRVAEDRGTDKESTISEETQQLVKLAEGLVFNLESDMLTEEECVELERVNSEIEEKQKTLDELDNSLCKLKKERRELVAKEEMLNRRTNEAIESKQDPNDKNRNQSLALLRCCMEYKIHDCSPARVHVSFLNGTLNFMFRLALKSTSGTIVELSKRSQLKDGVDPLTKFAFDSMWKATDDRHLNTCSDFRAILVELALVSAHTRMLAADLKAIAVSHTVVTDDNSISVEFIDPQLMMEFLLTFVIAPGTYPNDPVPIAIQVLYGNTPTEEIIVKAEKIKPGPSYLPRIVTEVEDALSKLPNFSV